MENYWPLGHISRSQTWRMHTPQELVTGKATHTLQNLEREAHQKQEKRLKRSLPMSLLSPLLAQLNTMLANKREIFTGVISIIV